MKVFVTGHRGYIGVHLIKELQALGHTVTGCDLGLFNDCAWYESAKADRELVTDIRALTEKDLSGHDAVMHLAAISNDPMGDLDESVTVSVNLEASIRLAETAKRAGVRRFLFSGSCSVYGAGAAPNLTEEDPLRPLTVYAKSKVETEEAVKKMAGPSFTPVFLRNATAYGDSPMFRLDLVANNLLSCARTTGEVKMLSDGTPWRPLVHCRDIARAFCAFLEAPQERIHNQSVNIGGDDENYQVKQVAEEVARLCPEARVTFAGDARPDPRDYRVSFGKLRRLLPDFRLAYTLRTGLEELNRRMTERQFSRADFEGDRFVRLRVLRNRLDRLQV